MLLTTPLAHEPARVHRHPAERQEATVLWKRLRLAYAGAAAGDVRYIARPESD
ncbi:hypothetical protein [Streptomyces puniciscabiei]|uniref:hypothetical protein n=1 Tax=Streptomyces puniciscabiei TaxID=164348 RepID=UPI0037BCAE95